MAVYVVLAVALLGSCWAAPPVDSDLMNYDVDADTWDLNTYGETYDYDDLDEEVDNGGISFEVGTMAPPAAVTHLHPAVIPENKTEEVTLLPQTTKTTIHPTLDFQGPGLFGPDTGLVMKAVITMACISTGMPTCLLCVCLSGSVYCDDGDLIKIPPLPKDTTHFYARFNKITAVKAKDFLNLNQLKRIDLTGNQISELDEDTFRTLPQLQDLFLADNRIPSLPELPATMRHIDVRNNHLTSAGMHREGFKASSECYKGATPKGHLPNALNGTLNGTDCNLCKCHCIEPIKGKHSKREEHRVTYMSGGRRTQVDYILCRRGNLKEISDCKVVVGESVARQHRMVVCRMTLMVCKKKRSKIEKKTKWWKLKKEECCEEFRQKLRQALGGQVVLPDDWETTAEVIRETGRKVLGVSSGRRKEDKETWWWNEEVQDSIQRKRLAKKKWDMDRTEENKQEYKELQRRVKREVSKAKQKAYEELYTRLDTREGEKDLYRLARQRDRDGKDVQQVSVIKDRDGRVLTSEQSVQRRWKEYFEELMNEENEREKRVEGVNSVEQKVDKIRKDEVRKALKRMKSGKAVGPDDIPVEVWKCLGEAAVEFLTSLFNRVLKSEKMPEEWRRSVLVPIFKNKGDVQSCSNYRGIKLMSHTMKLWERVVEARLRKVVEICEQQYGFMPRKSTTDAIFALRILMEKYRDGQRELHCVFVDLEKAYHRVPREELWYCMRKSGVAEKYIRVVQDMYERSRTVVRCAVGQTEEFNVEVGLHQGSALSPFLFAIVMDQLSEEVSQESPWTMMFADDIVICSESREQAEENLERWRFALERRGMKVSRSKTEYMCVNEREGSGTVRLQGEEVKKVQEFKYLGSTVQSNGEYEKEVKKRVQAGWNGWRKVSGVLCDRKISARIKGKVYRTVVRPAMLYGLETVSLRKRQESELEEMKDLQFLYLSDNRLDYIPVPLPESLQVLHLQNNNIQSLNEDTFCNSHDRSYIRKALEDIRLDGNPVDVNQYAQAYVCLPRVPVGNSH
ncbi:hypothetical protein QTP70_028938 [Hemibagrus guttatus]|uniref:ribonuclease H n=1 Tax=Hemibagrus guttatus TaxID=175788 RepID=A0AAE0UP79_9TELE|nr:hypothetical protein QTP70_028938 [Hemibagrus guttatus]